MKIRNRMKICRSQRNQYPLLHSPSDFSVTLFPWHRCQFYFPESAGWFKKRVWKNTRVGVQEAAKCQKLCSSIVRWLIADKPYSYAHVVLINWWGKVNGIIRAAIVKLISSNLMFASEYHNQYERYQNSEVPCQETPKTIFDVVYPHVLAVHYSRLGIHINDSHRRDWPALDSSSFTSSMSIPDGGNEARTVYQPHRCALCLLYTGT